MTLTEYFGKWLNHKDSTPARKINAEHLLVPVNALINAALADGVVLNNNPATGSLVSGQTLGGFRPQSCTQGAANSSHKQGLAVDIYDPNNSLDKWVTDEKLIKFGLYREHPNYTPKWCHLTIRAPGSKRRTFIP